VERNGIETSKGRFRPFHWQALPQFFFFIFSFRWPSSSSPFRYCLSPNGVKLKQQQVPPMRKEALGKETQRKGANAVDGHATQVVLCFRFVALLNVPLS
jgi:hypothetical protein